MVNPTSISIVKTVKEASAVCRSFLDGVVIFGNYKDNIETAITPN